MKIGVVFPQTEIGQDPAMIRDYTQAVESMRSRDPVSGHRGPL